MSPPGLPPAGPLTEAQSGLWFAQALDPTNPVFNTGQYCDLRGPLDLAAFRAAVDGASAEAEALALRFAEAPDGVSQAVDPGLVPRLHVVDLSGASDPETVAVAAIRAAMAQPVDPFIGPLARQVLYRLAPDRHLWAQQVHHLAIDGYGMVLLTARVAEIYAHVLGQGREGRPLAPLAGVLAEDAAYGTSLERAADAEWWRAAMAGQEEVVGMAPGRPLTDSHFLRFETGLAAPARELLLELAKSAGVNWPDALTALAAAYCRRFTGAPEISVGVPHMSRMGSASARVPAMVMNVLPLRITPDEAAPLTEFVRDVSAASAAARGHGRYRSEQLRRDLGLLGGNRRLYGPLINVQPYDRPPRFAGLETTLHVTGTGPVEDIHFTFRGDCTNALTLEVDANPALYCQADVDAHGARLAQFLTCALAAERLADVPTATPAEWQRELETFNAAAHPLPEASLTELIERAMAATPDAEALRFGGASLTYAELDRRTAALAAELRGRGVRAESLVAVALPRSFALVIALVAVLRAGGAYLPLDLDHPPARIATILDRARPLVVLGEGDPHGLYGERLLAPADWPQIAPAYIELPLPLPDDAAYVIYTSGSTGEPKGVLVTHRAIVNRLLWMGEHYSFGPQDRILQKTPATFDVSVWEFFLAFITGGALVVAPPGAHRDPAAIAALIREQQITTLHFVPSMLAAFLDAPESADLAVARVFCSGEELPAELRDRFHARMHGELHNLYGPTEAAVDVSYWPASADDTSRPVPIGHAVWNTRLVILDERMHPVPPGQTGQLYLGGVQLARGYVARDDLTAERFIADPFHPGERLYLTGDLARRRDDGAVVFLGRADHQVKIRGLRIELGEIEAAIAATGMARANAVLAREGRLVAYVVPGDGFGVPALRTALSQRLPDYMVPAAVVELAELPLSANGKLDRKQLPEPRFVASGDSVLISPTEAQVAAIFADLLAVEGVIGRADDFFALGGDSLSAVQLLLAIRQEWGRDPGLAALFDHPGVADLAALIDSGMGANDGPDNGLGPLIRLASADTDLPPLFVVHPAGGICWGYRQLAGALAPRRTVFGLQSPALDPAAPLPTSIAELARDYAATIARAAPTGPVHLAGWSVGGIIAQALACEMAAIGREVGLVALLDAYPSQVWRDEAEPTEAQAIRALLAIAGHDPEAHPELTRREQVTEFLRAGDSPLAALPGRTLDGVVRAVLGTNRLIRTHGERHFGGTLLHIRAGNDHADRPQLTAALWQPFASVVEEAVLPFLHSQLTGPAASARIAPLLAQHMAMMELASTEGAPAL